MKVFVSSLIAGHEDLRAAAVSAIRSLGHEVVRAEDFPATASSPQVACLDGVRDAGVVVLILAERYGAKQRSGLSATHEEFQAAKDTRPVLAFVRTSPASPREPEQGAFVREVQAWESGLFTNSFTGPDDLRSVVTHALHAWELSRARSVSDPSEMLDRAKALLPRNDRHSQQHGIAVVTAVAGGPRQSVIRPAKLEDAAFAERLQQMALFGPSKFFTTRRATEHRLKGAALVFEQAQGASFALDELGGIRATIPLESEARGAPENLVEEDVAAAMRTGLRFASAVLDEIDSTRSLRDVVPVTTILGASYHPWVRRAEKTGRNGSMSLRMGNDVLPPTHLTPPERNRSALTQELDVLVEDLTTLLRRVYRAER